MLEKLDEIVFLGAVASLVAGLATGAGALPVLFTKKISNRVLDVMLGFSAGVMLAATSFSLIVPAIDLGGTWVAVFGLLLGALVLHLVDRFIPHFHPIIGAEGPPSRLSKVWLFVIAITIHNFPEGLAVALPLRRKQYSRWRALGYATFTGLVEPIGGLLGVALISVSQTILPWGLAFAAGAMLFVVSDEMIPESHRKGFAREATFGLILGFVVMMFLDCYFV